MKTHKRDRTLKRLPQVRSKASSEAITVSNTLRKSAGVRVLVINMPWDDESAPHTCCEVAQLLFEEQGISCDIVYGDLIAIALLQDHDLLKVLTRDMASELVFNSIYYGCYDDTLKRFRKYLPDVGQAAEPSVYRRLLDVARELLVRIEAETVWGQYKAVVFPVCSRQFFSSLCLARLIKQQFPKLSIIFFGNGYDASLAQIIVTSFTEVDAFVPGKPGLALLRVVGSLINADVDRKERLKASHLLHEAFLSQRKSLRAAHALTLPIRVVSENGDAGSHSSQNLANVLVPLSSTHRATAFILEDPVLNRFDCVQLLAPLVELQKEKNYQFSFRASVAANLTRQEISLLREAGTLEVSAALLSLSEHALERMGRSGTVIEHLQFLRLSAENGINVKWHILWGAPREQAEDYQEMTALIPSIPHLSPPGFLPYSLAERSCANHRIPHDCAPGLPKELFGAANGLLARAFCTSESLPDSTDASLLQTRESFNSVLNHWRRIHARNLLTYSRGPGFVRIADRRAGQTDSRDTVITLADKQAEIFLFCDEPRHLSEIVESFATQLTPARIEKFLDILVDRNLCYRSSDNRFVALPIHRKLMRIR